MINIQEPFSFLGIRAIYPQKDTSRPEPGHETYPIYCVGKRSRGRIRRGAPTSPTSRCATDSFIWWRFKNGTRAPLIGNADQGSQFTSLAYIEAVEEAGTLVSMDGRGRCLDNVFVERLWRSLKYEDIYLRDYKDGLELEGGMFNWFAHYNDERPHQVLDCATPREVYRFPESHGARTAK